MPEDERTTPQVRLVYDLLIKAHPGYHNFRDEGDWAFAQKVPLSDPRSRAHDPAGSRRPRSAWESAALFSRSAGNSAIADSWLCPYRPAPLNVYTPAQTSQSRWLGLRRVGGTPDPL